VQYVWFEHVHSHVVESMSGTYAQRMDQLLNPWYQRDLKAGKITREEAKELVAELFLKCERSIGVLLTQNIRSASHGSFVYFQNITIGGVDAFGMDATNDMSYMILEVTRDNTIGIPSIALRYTPQTPDELIATAWSVIQTGIGIPAFFNDKPAVEHLLRRGWSLEDARNNCLSGCVAFACAGVNTMPRMPSTGAYNAAMIMEAAINEGKDIFDGFQMGAKTPHPKNFKTYDDMFAAFKEQTLYLWKNLWRIGRIQSKYTIEVMTRPFSSCLCDDAIEAGYDMSRPQSIRYWVPMFGFCSGMIDCVDTLAGIKKVIYDDKKCDWDTMLKALKADWKGYEELRQACVNAPKFGQDDPYVDLIARQVFEMYDNLAATFQDEFGPKGNEPYECQYHSISAFIMGGLKTAALPNGRKAHSPLADGGISPALGYGKDPIKVLKSVSKVDATKGERYLLNMRLNPSTTTRQFIDLIRVWGDLSCDQIQFNVFKTETLREAQKTPDKYPDLFVRVAGYSALFVSLTRATQEGIIARSENTVSKD
jgi:choline trimethylamine-lyase